MQFFFIKKRTTDSFSWEEKTIFNASWLKNCIMEREKLLRIKKQNNLESLTVYRIMKIYRETSNVVKTNGKESE